MRSHYVNDIDGFIGGWYFDDTSICDELIEYHKTAKDRHDGPVGNNQGILVVDPEKKCSVDCTLDPNQDIFIKYMKNLHEVTKQYVSKFQYCNMFSKWGITQGARIQYYPPEKGGYKVWHCERGNSYPTIASRHLVYMTYLNDVTDGGETEFLYQKLAIKPEKGLTLIWLPDWSHTHRGNVSATQDKFIITGWYNFF